MKKAITATLACLMLLFVSCNDKDNYGYPSKVNFSTNGGKKVILGSNDFDILEINSYAGNGKVSSTENSDSLIVTNQWLTVRCRKYDKKLVLIAEPNRTGKSRKMYVSGWVMDSSAEIKVTQN
jgi:hypothetical protein